jgi:hypothetical protein
MRSNSALLTDALGLQLRRTHRAAKRGRYASRKVFDERRPEGWGDPVL